jgi:hypothetical protein
MSPPIQRASQTKLGYVAGIGWATQMGQGFPTRIPESVRYLDAFRYDNEPPESRAGGCILLNEQGARDFTADCLDPNTTDSDRPLVVLWGDSHTDTSIGFKTTSPS